MHIHRRFAPLALLALLVSAFIAPASFAQGTKPLPFGLNPAKPVVNQPNDRAFVPGQVLVRLRNDARFAATGNVTKAFQARFGALNISATKTIAPQTFRLDVAADADVRALAQQLAADPAVAYAQPNYLRYFTRSVNDPLSTFQYAINKINAVGAWDVTTGNSNITIAIVDSGISLGHPEFAGRILPGFDFANNDSDPSDDVGHGTHVAGIAAASGDNGEGVAGMCWQCRILPVKVGGEEGISTEALVSGIRFAVDKGARVINLSLGGDEESPLEREAVQYATNKNVLVVAAAGNSAEEGNPVQYPAAFDEVLAVGATNENDQRAYFSEIQPYVDVSAPGYNIASTWASSADLPVSYAAISGTSMSAPYVSGLAGLLLSINPNLDVNTLKAIITSTADDLGQSGQDWEYGVGRINAARAVAAVRVPAFEPVANPNQPDVAYFPETQHTLSGTFKTFWEQNGGLAVFGFPISQEFQETTAEGTYTVQYFERNRFELHPENPAPYNVLLGRLSDVQLKRQGRDWFTFPKGQETPGCQYFAETQHTVCEPFLSYWKNNGLKDPNLSADGRSLALFGLPLSEATPEVNSSGENVVTQWFERARFEFHPDKPQQFQVLLGLLGNETARPGGNTMPQSGQTPPDRCSDVPAPINASITPSNCVLFATEFVAVMTGFAPGEDVVLAVVANGQPIGGDQGKAGDDGQVSLGGLAVLPPNIYTIAVQGQQSGNQAVVYLKVVDR